MDNGILPESRISKSAERGPLPIEIQPPGTEFLDAETGGQNSIRKTANVHRD